MKAPDSATPSGAPAPAPTPVKSARRRSREFALQAIYSWLLNDLELGLLIAQTRDIEAFERADAPFFETLVTGVYRQAEALRTQISPLIDRPIGELSPVEHAILLIGTFELVHQPDVPYRVVINEAVELAKSFGGTDGFKYVNGVLDKLAPSLRADEIKSSSKPRGLSRA